MKVAYKFWRKGEKLVPSLDYWTHGLLQIIVSSNLRALQNPGRNNSWYTQFDSIRKLRAVYLTAYKSSLARCLDDLIFVSGKDQFSAMMNSTTQSKVFVKLMKGCKKAWSDW